MGIGIGPRLLRCSQEIGKEIANLCAHATHSCCGGSSAVVCEIRGVVKITARREKRLKSVGYEVRLSRCVRW